MDKRQKLGSGVCSLQHPYSSSSSSLARHASAAQEVGDGRCSTPELWARCHSLLHSRCFVEGPAAAHQIAPGIDMANHSFSPNATVRCGTACQLCCMQYSAGHPANVDLVVAITASSQGDHGFCCGSACLYRIGEDITLFLFGVYGRPLHMMRDLTKSSF